MVKLEKGSSVRSGSLILWRKKKFLLLDKYGSQVGKFLKQNISHGITIGNLKILLHKKFEILYDYQVGGEPNQHPNDDFRRLSYSKKEEPNWYFWYLYDIYGKKIFVATPDKDGFSTNVKDYTYTMNEIDMTLLKWTEVK